MLISRCFVKHRVISGCLPAVCRCLEHSRNFRIALQVAALSEPEGKEAPLLSAAPRRTTRPRGSGAGPAAAIPHCKHFRFRPSTTFRFLPRHVSQGLSSSAPRRAGGISAAAEVAAAQKREERLRKFRELHLKRVRGGTEPGRVSRVLPVLRGGAMGERRFPDQLGYGSVAAAAAPQGFVPDGRFGPSRTGDGIL